MIDHASTNATAATATTTEVACPSCAAPRTDPSASCPHCGAPPMATKGDDHRRRPNDAQHTAALLSVRASDIEPYVGLRYLSKLFKLMAIIMVLLLVAEVVTGLVAQGVAAVPTLLSEVSRLVVLAGLLWGAGDLAILLIDMGHDVRAGRILLGRQTVHHFAEQPAPKVERAEPIVPQRDATAARLPAERSD